MSKQALDQLQAAKNAALQLTQTEQQLRANYKELVAQRDKVHFSLATQEECIANSDRLVDAVKAREDKERSPTICRAVSGSIERRVNSHGALREQKIQPKLPPIGDSSGTL